MARTHPEFSDVSPRVGEIDERRLEKLAAADPDTALSLLADAATATDKELRAAAHRLAARVFVATAHNGLPRARGIGKLVSSPATLLGDLDLERTLERTGGPPPTSPDHFVSRTWARPTRAVCLLVDRSGSMRGKGLALAALAAAAVVLSREQGAEVSVLTFSDQVLTLSDQHRARTAEEVVTALLTLRGHGRTDISLALRSAARMLADSGASYRTAVLVGDCLATSGSDPLTEQVGLDNLAVLGTSRRPESVEAGRRLARGRGHHHLVESVTDLWRVLPRLLS